MGGYPIFSCGDWTQLPAELEHLEGTIVSLSLVTDPFGDYDERLLRECFPDVMVPFKEHFVIDLTGTLETSVCSHHRRYAKNALKHVQVEQCRAPETCIDDWMRLYTMLIKKRGITGIATFSRHCFEKQLRVPGIVAFRAYSQDRTIGMLLWYVQGDKAYYHLGAYDEMGYRVHASFGLFWSAIRFFAEAGLQRINLGAGAGTKSDGADGLSRFKRGWATGTQTAYFCGRILDRGKYAEISKATGVGKTDYFPAYRTGEFA